MNNPVGIYFAFWEKEWDADYAYYIDKVKRLGFWLPPPGRRASP